MPSSFRVRWDFPRLAKVGTATVVLIVLSLSTLAGFVWPRARKRDLHRRSAQSTER